MPTCESHPRYRGLRKPRPTSLNPGGCILCWAIWEAKHPGKHPILDSKRVAKRMRTLTDFDGKTYRVLVVKHPTLPVEGYVDRSTRTCTGCFEVGEYGSGTENYPLDPKLGIRLGGGCSECGYTGKVRCSIWVPFDSAELLRAEEAARGEPLT